MPPAKSLFDVCGVNSDRLRTIGLCCSQHSHEEILDQSRCFRPDRLWFNAVVKEED